MAQPAHQPRRVRADTAIMGQVNSVAPLPQTKQWPRPDQHTGPQGQDRQTSQSNCIHPSQIRTFPPDLIPMRQPGPCFRDPSRQIRPAAQISSLRLAGPGKSAEKRERNISSTGSDQRMSQLPGRKPPPASKMSTWKVSTRPERVRALPSSPGQ
jgi:hypothetical protein